MLSLHIIFAATSSAFFLCEQTCNQSLSNIVWKITVEKETKQPVASSSSTSRPPTTTTAPLTKQPLTTSSSTSRLPTTTTAPLKPWSPYVWPSGGHVPQGAFDPYEKIVSEKVQYIPLGHHSSVKCEAFEMSSDLSSKQDLSVEWWLLYKNSTQMVSYKLNSTHSGVGQRISVANNVVYLFGMPSLLNGSVIVCRVLNANYSGVVTLVSRTILVAQDCGLRTEYETPWMNKFNPCRYGSCRVRDDHGFQLLECRCMEQYTGIYCDKLVNGATFYELFFYSPIIAMVVVLLIVGCCYDYVAGHPKEKRLLFEKHLPKANATVDLKKCYPAMFITQQQYAEMVAAIEKDTASPKEGAQHNAGEKNKDEAKNVQEAHKVTAATTPVKEEEKLERAPKSPKPTLIQQQPPPDPLGKEQKTMSLSQQEKQTI